jgi:hypothetical protein
MSPEWYIDNLPRYSKALGVMALFGLLSSLVANASDMDTMASIVRTIGAGFWLSEIGLTAFDAGVVTMLSYKGYEVGEAWSVSGDRVKNLGFLFTNLIIFISSETF